MRHVLRSIVASLLLHGTFAIAAPDESTKQACRDIATAVPGRVSYPNSIAYLSEITKYWSTALRDLKPACVILPKSVEEVSAAIKVLSKYPGVNFAAKSGGHDPNPGHGSVQDGVLIALREVSGTTYDNESNLAYIKPGGEWNDVIGALDPQGVAVVGGRLGLVGVGGYLLQGGISFLSAQYGLAADSVVGWETVLPNGTIANIDASRQKDLAVAMRGSGSQFGIVTRFTIEAHPIGKVWGGMRIYDAANADKIYAALHNFIPNGADDPKAAIILTNVDAVGGIRTILIFYFYDGTTPPINSPLAELLAIPSILSTTKARSYADLLKTNGEGAALLNSRISFRTSTIPYIKSRPRMYTEIAKKWKEITASYLTNPIHLTSKCSVDFQPFPAIIGKESQRRGGNAMGISEADGDRLLLEFQCSWALAADDPILYAMSRDITAWLDVKVTEWLAEDNMQNRYLPLFMNDAMGDQNVTGTYKEYAKFKNLQEDIDPQGLFHARAGGYKY
ncbi:FAD-binding domain-containing protein [Aaosphaeria arxii CBS 175.79]|uniref:FAD-binding domain-containing protein n=1 Tax=Aaosphaeria arxii CBS 175.79 TaxID=1450172 RepID=A0A6A5Y2P4_9PLEO|nr:FAD-binding domain-containing protein [Aaosphaeria arxii CBS 175.79]KAF2019503.1 FAD-binding domain-containing protein [Aaosphaeria arxii CBS 175.79]